MTIFGDNHGISSADTFSVTTDAEGRFQTDCGPYRVVLRARSADGALGAIADVGAQDNAPILLAAAPMASVTGQVVDQEGRRLTHWPLDWGLVVEEGGVDWTLSDPRTEAATDEEGRFTLAGLVVGQAYRIRLETPDRMIRMRDVRPKKAGVIDLGTIQVEVPDDPEPAN